MVCTSMSLNFLIVAEIAMNAPKPGHTIQTNSMFRIKKNPAPPPALTPAKAKALTRNALKNQLNKKTINANKTAPTLRIFIRRQSLCL